MIFGKKKGQHSIQFGNDRYWDGAGYDHVEFHTERACKLEFDKLEELVLPIVSNVTYLKDHNRDEYLPLKLRPRVSYRVGSDDTRWIRAKLYKDLDNELRALMSTYYKKVDLAGEYGTNRLIYGYLFANLDKIQEARDLVESVADGDIISNIKIA